MIFTVPIRTVSALNMREHWAKKARRVREERTATSVAAFADRAVWREVVRFRNSAESGQRCVVTLTRIAPRELDDDNLRGALKGPRDQVAEILGVDDRDPVVRWEYAQRKGKPKEWAVEVRIEEAAQAHQERAGRERRDEDGRG